MQETEILKLQLSLTPTTKHISKLETDIYNFIR